MDIDQALEQIRAVQKSTKPILIAIDGFGGAGKTTLADMLALSLGSSFVIHMDDFIKDKLINMSPDKLGFDRPRLTKEVLVPLNSGQAANYRKYLWADDSLSEPNRVPDVRFVIIEGISSLHPDIADYFDYKIWVDTELNTAKQRGKLRDKGNENEAHWDAWAENDQAYMEKFKPNTLANIVIENN